jgi:hypothetical protein
MPRGVKRSKNWELFLDLVAMGLSINQVAELMRINRGSAFGLARRDPLFRHRLDQAMAERGHILLVDPQHFVDRRTLQPILDDNLEKIPRRQPGNLEPWLRRQMAADPFNLDRKDLQ